MAEGMSFSFPSLLFHEGRTYGQPEVVPISLPQVATGLRSRLPGSFRRRGFQPDLLMPQGTLWRRGRSDSFTPAKLEEDAVGNQCRIRQTLENQPLVNAVLDDGIVDAPAVSQSCVRGL